MSTRSAVAIRTEDGGWKGRYVHFDGYPEGVGQAVKDIVVRDGRAKAVAMLTEKNYGWSSVDGEAHQELSTSYHDGRFRAIPGYGIAYTTKEGQSSPDEWIESKDPGWGIEYAHIIESDGSVTTIEVE